jgi:hypothetical protein
MKTFILIVTTLALTAGCRKTENQTTTGNPDRPMSAGPAPSASPSEEVIVPPAASFDQVAPGEMREADRIGTGDEIGTGNDLGTARTGAVPAGSATVAPGLTEVNPATGVDSRGIGPDVRSMGSDVRGQVGVDPRTTTPPGGTVPMGGTVLAPVVNAPVTGTTGPGAAGTPGSTGATGTAGSPGTTANAPAGTASATGTGSVGVGVTTPAKRPAATTPSWRTVPGTTGLRIDLPANHRLVTGASTRAFDMRVREAAGDAAASRTAIESDSNFNRWLQSSNLGSEWLYSWQTTRDFGYEVGRRVGDRTYVCSGRVESEQQLAAAMQACRSLEPAR